MLRNTLYLVAIIAVATAFPTGDDVIAKMDPGPRYQYVQRADGTLHLADMWLKASDVAPAARFNPDTDNVYHLFTRENPTVSQPFVLGIPELVLNSNFNIERRTVVLVHGWTGSVIADSNTVLVPAFLAAADVNVLVVDWSVGAEPIYLTAVLNTLTSGEAVARFLTWLNSITGATLSQYHITGHSLGGHQVGIIGRNLGGVVPYITALDPAGPAWSINSNRFRATDGIYTEAISTNVVLLGYRAPLADVNFYVNGGYNMPGCNSNSCDHDRCFYYMAESVVYGGFTGRECATYLEALTNNCAFSGTLHMGGLTPKTGSTGVYYLTTNADFPFSQG